MNNKKNKKQGLGAFQLGGFKFNGLQIAGDIQVESQICIQFS